MYLHRIHLNPRCREVRRDLADPYQLHATLCRAFCEPERRCPPGEILWRLEPERDADGNPRVLVQSTGLPDWSRIGVKDWLANAAPAVELRSRLGLDSLEAGRRFRFRLRGNPCVTRDGKRLGLFRTDEQEAWLDRKSRMHGFSLSHLPAFDLLESGPSRIDVRISQEQMLRGKQHGGNGIRVFSVLYDGILRVTEPGLFTEAVRKGVGHGKVMGLGMISIVPV